MIQTGDNHIEETGWHEIHLNWRVNLIPHSDANDLWRARVGVRVGPVEVRRRDRLIDRFEARHLDSPLRVPVREAKVAQRSFAE